MKTEEEIKKEILFHSQKKATAIKCADVVEAAAQIEAVKVLEWVLND